MATTRTAGEASKLLADYERLNSDLPDDTVRQMAPFVLAPLVGMDSLDQLFGRSLGQTPKKHKSWLWKTAMRASGLGHLWDEFVRQVNEDSLREALYWLRGETSKAEWELLSTRVGAPLRRLNNGGLVQPATYSETSNTRSYWTGGGTWDRRSGMTRIIVFGEHLDNERDYEYHTLTRALGPEGARSLETELHGLIDPEKELVPHAKHKAVRYARHRIPPLAGWNIDRASFKTASWFFQCRVQDPGGGWYHFEHEADYPHRQTQHGRERWWDWLPPLRGDNEES